MLRLLSFTVVVNKGPSNRLGWYLTSENVTLVFMGWLVSSNISKVPTVTIHHRMAHTCVMCRLIVTTLSSVYTQEALKTFAAPCLQLLNIYNDIIDVNRGCMSFIPSFLANPHPYTPITRIREHIQKTTCTLLVSSILNGPIVTATSTQRQHKWNWHYRWVYTSLIKAVPSVCSQRRVEVM